MNDESRIRLLADEETIESNLVDEKKSFSISLPFNSLQEFKPNYSQEGYYIDRRRAETPLAGEQNPFENKKLPDSVLFYIKSFNDFDTNVQFEATCSMYYGRYPNVARLPNMRNRAHSAAQPCVPFCTGSVPPFPLLTMCEDEKNPSFAKHEIFFKVDLTRPLDMFSPTITDSSLRSENPLWTVFDVIRNICCLPIVFTCCSPCIVTQAFCCCCSAMIGLRDDCKIAIKSKPIKEKRNGGKKAMFRKEVSRPLDQIMEDNKYMQNPVTFYNDIYYFFNGHHTSSKREALYGIQQVAGKKNSLERSEAANHRLYLARLYLALCYKSGKNGMPKDPNKAVYWYELVIKDPYGYDLLTKFHQLITGNGKTELQIGQHYLGMSYENGEGVIKNLNTALYWYKKAAEQGYKPAVSDLKKLNLFIESNRKIETKEGNSTKLKQSASGTKSETYSIS